MTGWGKVDRRVGDRRQDRLRLAAGDGHPDHGQAVRAVMVPPKLASNVVRIRPLPKDYVPAQELERDQQGWTFKML